MPSAAAKPAGPGEQGEPKMGHLLVLGSTQCSWSGADPVCPWWCLCKKMLFSQPPQLAWGPTECVVRGTVTSPCKKTHAPEVVNSFLISEPCLNHPPQQRVQSPGPQHMSTTSSTGVLSAEDNSLIPAEHQRVLTLIHAACTHRIGSRERNSRAKNIPGCLCL